MSKVLIHYGMPRRSGRYPWGSGGEPYQSASDFRGHIQELKKQGLTEVQIAEGEGLSVAQLRARVSLAKTEQRNADRNTAIRLKDKGYSNMEIARKMSTTEKTWNESSVRSLLDPVLAERATVTDTIANTLRESVDKNRFVDVGVGVENHMGIRRTRLNTALEKLQAEGYQLHTVKVTQVGIPGQFTNMKVLGAPDTTWKELVNDKSKIKPVMAYSEDFGRTFNSDLGLGPIQYVSSKRVHVKYAEDGGSAKDGVIELRRGVPELSLGKSKYAQVRIGVDGTHYLKGMAIYGDNLPDGADIVFNTNKHNTGNKLDALKSLKKDKEGNIEQDNPFGATIKRNGQRGAINIVNEEGDWEKWSKTISSQILSKQPVTLAKAQLEAALKQKREEYEEIMALTNPVVKRQLLTAFADDCDSSSVHLKAAALPRQASKVILPVPAMKETEVYAPTFKDGETVVLIRHPHGGTFEIPQLTVNNKSKAARAIMENAPDAIGIHPKVAQKLSGADFDGDSVIVIPNNQGRIRSSAPLKGLENFDPIEAYKPYDGMRTIDGGVYNASTRKVDYGGKKPRTQTRQTRMGEVSNLITDMTIKVAGIDEIARAVRHSMVVIDSEKHHLDYKRSYVDNGIASLSEKYQRSARGGASTLISKASSEVRIDHRKLLHKPDPITGEKVYVFTGEMTKNKKGELIKRTISSTRMAEEKDARKLSSGRPIEEVYASHANNLKALANQSRLNASKITPTPYSPSAHKAYEKEVASLELQLNNAMRNKPIERQAQIIATSIVKRKQEANPDMDDDELKKIRSQALSEARIRTGAIKSRITLSDKEWEAIQAGAISPSRLTQILQNGNLDQIKNLATPRSTTEMSPAKVSRAKLLLASGATIADVADVLGVSTSTVSKALD